MFRLDRYVFSEILGPMGLGFLVYTFIMLLRFLFRSAEMIITRGVPAELVGQLLLLSLPNIVVVTIPMALLVGILIAIGRLSADSELVALRSCGISLFFLFRPIVLLSALLTVVNLYLMLEVVPQGNHALQQLRVEILTHSGSQAVEARVPYTGWPEKTLFVFETPPEDRRWKGVVLADSIPQSQNEVLIAEWGEAQADEAQERVVLTLENGYLHRLDFHEPEDYAAIFQAVWEREVPTQDRRQAARSVRRGMRELRLKDLHRVANDLFRTVTERRLATIELHKKFSIPAACLAFGLLGLPLGFTSSRGGRWSGFALSIIVFLVYYVLLNSGEKLAGKGVVPPWLAIWFSNLLLVAWGLFLLARRNRDKSLLLSNLNRWIQEHLWGGLRSLQRRRRERRIARQRAATGGRRNRAVRLAGLPELPVRFPNSMDRYILRLFFQVLALATLSGISVYLVADLTGNVDDILNNQVPLDVVLSYYQYKSVAIVYEIAPILVLMTTLTTFGLLSRSNEITACRACGMSLYRLAAPVVVAAILVAGLCWLLQSEILAATNQRVAALDARMEGRELAQGYRRADRRWLPGEGRRLYNYLHYDADRQELHRLQVFELDSRYRLARRTLAERASYEGEGWWTFNGGWVRTWTFDGEDELTFHKFDQPERHRLPEGPEFFAAEYRQPDEMSYWELSDYIERLTLSGQRVPELEVRLHKKIAYPAISLVMALVALPFSFRLGRSGTLYGIGLSLVLGVIFMALMAFFSALGEAAMLPPLVAVWSPSVIFALFSLYLFLGVRT